MTPNRFVLALFLLCTEAVSAFAPATATRTVTSSTTSLKLVPEQGRQLVAFSQAALAQKAKESASKASHLSSNSEGRLRKIVTRLLGVGGETRPLFIQDDLLDHMHHEDDEVMYPIVGFNLVDGHALPMVHQNAACQLHLQNTGIDENVVGFYSQDGHVDMYTRV